MAHIRVAQGYVCLGFRVSGVITINAIARPPRLSGCRKRARIQSGGDGRERGRAFL